MTILGSLCKPLTAASRDQITEHHSGDPLSVQGEPPIQEHQRKQTETFLRSDRFVSRLAMRNLPFLVKTGLAPSWLGSGSGACSTVSCQSG